MRVLLTAALVVSAAAPPAGIQDREAAFTEFLRGRPRVAVCIWSPHMPLSVDAVREVAEAARVLGIPAVALLDPRADADYAAAIAAAHALPQDALRMAPVGGPMRIDAFQHAPTVVAFAAGEQAGSVIRGYMTSEAYIVALRQRFSTRN